MARQKGIIRIKGSLGGITFYQRNGQDLSKTTNGPDKNKIQHSPNFIRTRENNQEFAGAATIGKALRVGLVKDFDEMSDTNTTARITRLIKSVISKGTGSRGQRMFSPTGFASEFVGFPFSERIKFDSVFLAPYSVTVSAGRDQISMIIPDFNTGNLVHAPAGATHFRVINLFTVLSQYQFSVTTKKYEPNDPLNSANAFNASGYIPLGTDVGSDTTIVSAIGTAPTILATSAIISCIGIEFYQEVGGAMYLLSSGNAMKIQAVY